METTVSNKTVQNVKIGLGIVLIGSLLAFFCPLFTNAMDGNYKLDASIGPGFLGLALIAGGFLWMRRFFAGDESRWALMIMALAMVSRIIFHVILLGASEDKDGVCASLVGWIFTKLGYNTLLLFLVILASFVFTLAIGFRKLQQWSELKGMSLCMTGSFMIGVAYLVLCLFIRGVMSTGQINQAITDWAEIISIIGVVLFIAGLGWAVFPKYSKIEDIEELLGIGDADSIKENNSNTLAAPVCKKWSEMSSEQLYKVLSNNKDYTRKDHDEVSMELLRRRDPKYLGQFQKKSDYALACIIKNPSQYLMGDVYAASEVISTRPSYDEYF